MPLVLIFVRVIRATVLDIYASVIVCGARHHPMPAHPAIQGAIYIYIYI